MFSIQLENKIYSPSDFSEQPFYEEWLINIQRVISFWFGKEEVLKIKTSGSTGLPKEIIISKKQIEYSALLSGRYFDLKPNQSSLLCIPSDKIGGIMQICRCILFQMKLICVKPTANPLIQIPLISVDTISLLPNQLYEILKDENQKSNLRQFKNILIGGGMLAQNLRNQLREENFPAYLTYGMTETISHIAIQNINRDDPDVYTVFDEIEISTDDRDCLCISNEILCNETVITNDVVELISNKSFRYKGRWDNIINSAGVKIFAENLEDKLYEIMDRPFFISSLPDPKYGQSVVLIIESEKQMDDLVNKLKSKLEPFEIPKRIIYLKNFVRAGNGKIQRKNTLQSIQSL